MKPRNPNYYEAVVLVTIQRLNQEGKFCNSENLVSHTGMAYRTVAKTIVRLQEKGRLEVIRTSRRTPTNYIVKDPPTDKEYTLAAVHLTDRMETPNGKPIQ